MSAVRVRHRPPVSRHWRSGLANQADFRGDYPPGLRKSARARITVKSETADVELMLRACRFSPEGQAESRQIDSFNSLEARNATFLLALI
jgi:hypothetical protein